MAIKWDLTPVTDEDLLSIVKQLNDYGELTEDDTKLNLRIQSAKLHLLSCDVPEEVVNSSVAVEVIAAYVEDPMSEFVRSKTTQLRMCKYEQL